MQPCITQSSSGALRYADLSDSCFREKINFLLPTERCSYLRTNNSTMHGSRHLHYCWKWMLVFFSKSGDTRKEVIGCQANTEGKGRITPQTSRRNAEVPVAHSSLCFFRKLSLLTFLALIVQ